MRSADALSVFVNQPQLAVRNGYAYASGFLYCPLRRQPRHACRTFRLTVGRYPTLAVIPAPLRKLHIQRFVHLTAALGQQLQIRQIHSEESHHIQYLVRVGYTGERTRFLLFDELPEHRVRHVPACYQQCGANFQMTENHRQAHRVVQRQYHQRTVTLFQFKERADVQSRSLDIFVAMPHQFRTTGTAGCWQ